VTDSNGIACDDRESRKTKKMETRKGPATGTLRDGSYRRILVVFKGIQTAPVGRKVSGQGSQKCFIQRKAEDSFKDFDEIGRQSEVLKGNPESWD
jgi:hypothetical protein